MTYVADTHALIWYVSGDTRRLGRGARRVFSRLERGLDSVVVSVISLHEVAALLQAGRLRIRIGWEGWLEALQAVPGLRIEPVTLDDVDQARAAAALPDPVDRLLVGTALRLRAALLTADEKIATSGLVPVVWD